MFSAKRGGVLIVRVLAPTLSVLALGLLGGCGGSSSTGSASTVPSSPASSMQGGGTHVDAVAFVSGSPIPKSSYSHWVTVEKTLGAPADAGHRALGFLLTSEWVLGEAAARKLSVSDAEVKQRLAQLEHQSFPKKGSLERFFARSHET